MNNCPDLGTCDEIEKMCLINHMYEVRWGGEDNDTKGYLDIMKTEGRV